MRKEPKSNDESHGQSNQNEAPSKERAKEKIKPETIKKHGPKKIKKMKSPKRKWAKFKKWTQIEDIAEHER